VFSFCNVSISNCSSAVYFQREWHCIASYCADVPLRINSLTHAGELIYIASVVVVGLHVSYAVVARFIMCFKRIFGRCYFFSVGCLSASRMHCN